MKKQANIIIAVVIALLAMIILILNQKDTRIGQMQNRLFGIDSSEINRIVIEEDENSITLMQEGKEWVTDAGVTVKPEAIHSFFEAQKRIQIKAPASIKVRDDVIKQVNISGLKVQMTRINGKKTEYYLVYDQNNNTGTYLMLPDAKTPYQVFLPGYSRKELISLYPTNPEFWREKHLFDIHPDDITSITLDYAGEPDESFRVAKEGADYILYDLQGNRLTSLGRETGWTYFQSFTTLPYQQSIDTTEVKATTAPYASLKIDLNTNQVFQLELYNIINDAGELMRDFLWVKQSGQNSIFEVRFVDIALMLNSRQEFLQ